MPYCFCKLLAAEITDHAEGWNPIGVNFDVDTFRQYYNPQQKTVNVIGRIDVTHTYKDSIGLKVFQAFERSLTKRFCNVDYTKMPVGKRNYRISHSYTIEQIVERTLEQVEAAPIKSYFYGRPVNDIFYQIVDGLTDKTYHKFKPVSVELNQGYLNRGYCIEHGRFRKDVYPCFDPMKCPQCLNVLYPKDFI